MHRQVPHKQHTVLIEISYRMDSSGAQKGECRVHPGQVVTSPTAENVLYMKG